MHIRLHTTAIAEIQGSCRSTGWQFVGTERQIFFFFFKALHLKPSCVSCHLGWGGFTPLHYAALHGNRVLVDLFLSNGADPNLTCDAGQTAFHFGCRWASISSLCHNLILFPFLSRFLTSMTTDKETSTSCTKWCSTEPTCASQTCKGKRPCIMQWLGGTCKWRRNRIARAAGITFWRRTVCTNSMLLSQCRSALLVGNGNVSLHRHWQVPSDTASPGCIHWQYRSGPISAEKSGVRISSWPALTDFEHC